MEIKKSLWEDKAFWLALACVLIIISSIWLFDYSGIVGNAVQSSMIVGHTVQSISYMKEDQDLLVGITDVKGLHLADLKFEGTVSDATITIEEDKNIKFEGTAYSKFKLSFQNGEVLKKVIFTLKLKDSKLKSLGLPKDEVRLYAGTKEIALTTAKKPNIESSQEYSFFEAVSSETGEFVIGKKAQVAEAAEVKKVEEPVEKKTEPVVEKKPLVKEQPKPVQKPAPKSFFSKIADFFKGLFN